MPYGRLFSEDPPMTGYGYMRGRRPAATPSGSSAPFRQAFRSPPRGRGEPISTGPCWISSLHPRTNSITSYDTVDPDEGQWFPNTSPTGGASPTPGSGGRTGSRRSITWRRKEKPPRLPSAFSAAYPGCPVEMVRRGDLLEFLDKRGG